MDMTRDGEITVAEQLPCQTRACEMARPFRLNLYVPEAETIHSRETREKHPGQVPAL